MFVAEDEDAEGSVPPTAAGADAAALMLPPPPPAKKLKAAAGVGGDADEPADADDKCGVCGKGLSKTEVTKCKADHVMLTCDEERPCKLHVIVISCFFESRAVLKGRSRFSILDSRIMHLMISCMLPRLWRVWFMFVRSHEILMFMFLWCIALLGCGCGLWLHSNSFSRIGGQALLQSHDDSSQREWATGPSGEPPQNRSAPVCLVGIGV